jgi:hypothetical protein
MRSQRFSPSRKLSIAVDVMGSLASILTIISFPPFSYGVRNSVRSSRVCCHGFGSLIPFSRSFRHCCMADMVGPLPLIQCCMTRYAFTTISVRVPSSRNSCHANPPRGSLPCALTRDVSCCNTIWAVVVILSGLLHLVGMSFGRIRQDNVRLQVGTLAIVVLHIV